MKNLLKLGSVFLTTMLLVFTCFASVQVLKSDNSSLGVVTKLKCGAGLECSKTGLDVVAMVASPGELESVEITGSLSLGAATAFASADATPTVADKTLFETHTDALTITAFDNGVLGQVIIVISKGAVTFDVTGTTLKCGSTDLVTAAGDVTTFVYDGTNWNCIARLKASANLN